MGLTEYPIMVNASSLEKTPRLLSAFPSLPSLSAINSPHESQPPVYSQHDVPPDREHVCLAKSSLRQNGPILFIEPTTTSYDATPYLAVDQLSHVANNVDPERQIKRLQIVSGNGQTELLLWNKQCNGRWELETVRVVIDAEHAAKLDSKSYFDKRGVVDRSSAAFEIQSEIRSKLHPIASSAKIPSIEIIWPDADNASNPSSEIGRIFREQQQAIVACTGDSKVFAPMREHLRFNGAALQDSLVVLGGIHANAAHDAIVHEEAISLVPTFDLIHTWPIGEHDFAKLLRAFNQQDEIVRRHRLGTLENFTATVIDGRLAENGTIWLLPNPEQQWGVQGIKSCPSREQLPTHWGSEHPFVRRLKGARGCQFHCAYCATSGNYQAGDIEQVQKFFDSVVVDIQERGINPRDVLVYFEDANFAGAFAKKVLELSKNYPFKLGVQIRYDCVMPLLPDLATGHAGYLFLGMESHDDAIRNSLNKQSKLSPEQMYEIASRIKRAGIDYLISGIVGLPNEDIYAMARTIAFMRLQSPQIISIELPKVYPATEFANDFRVQTGIDPADAYTRGEGLIQTFNAGKESKGSLLEASLSESCAVHLMSVVEEFMQMDFEKLWAFARFDKTYIPLGSPRYTRAPDDVGFYRRA